MDCKHCAECCITDSLFITNSERRRIAAFIEDQQIWFLDQAPKCPFLNDKNKCNIYPVRPLACAGFKCKDNANQKCSIIEASHMWQLLNEQPVHKVPIAKLRKFIEEVNLGKN